MTRIVLSMVAAFCAMPLLAAQTPSSSARPPMPRDYHSPRLFIDGVWITPVPNAPFTATVQIVSHNKLPDGTDHVVKTVNHIGRSSSGRIRNEMHVLVPQSFNGEPRLLSAHIYDPNTRISIMMNTTTHIARQTVLPQPPSAPAVLQAPAQQQKVPGVTETQLGEQTFQNVRLIGTRKTRVVPADHSGTNEPATITDDYWYSPDLSIYLIIRHDDPRTGEQLVAVTQIERGEPAAELMTVPDDYKLVDETPPPRPAPAPTH